VLVYVKDVTADAFRAADLPLALMDDIDRLVEAGAAASDAPDAPVPVVKVFAVGSTRPAADLVMPMDFPASGDAVREGQRRVALQCVVQAVAGLQPTVEGSPILRRVTEAVAAEPGLDVLHVDTPGTANVAPLDLREVPPEASPRQVADGLQRAGHLPDLGGLSVTFHHLGVTVEGRQPEPQVRWLTALWLEICGVSGGVCSARTVVAAPSDRPASQHALPDPAVPVHEDQALSLCDVTEGIAGTALFQPDSSDLLPGAERLLASTADTLLRTPGLVADVVGHTALAPGSTEAERRHLSEQRAARVVEVLVAQGVDPARLTATGLGATQRLVEDVAPNGQLLEPEATKNRRVEITYRCPADD
jgi:outer membrane protein OmpA-like peptidoglycan-associated protein